MLNTIHADRLEGILANALAGRRNVKRRSLSGFEWSASGNCSSPVTVQLTGRPDRDKVSSGFLSGGRMRMMDSRYVSPSRDNMAYFCDIEVRCRKCERCAKARSAMWRERASGELKKSVRTWFLTLTVRPDDRYRIELEARAAASERSVSWPELTEDQRFSRVCEALGRHVTLYLKRVRKASQAKLRYVLVYERHRDGFPHVHALIHETSPERGVKKRTLSARDDDNPVGQWLLGFSQVRLVRADGADIGSAAFYVTKYISKDARIRIRASVRYGREPSRDKTSSGHSQSQTGLSVKHSMTPTEGENAQAVLPSCDGLNTRLETQSLSAEIAALFSDPHGSSGKAVKPRLKSKRDHWFHDEPDYIVDARRICAGI